VDAFISGKIIDGWYGSVGGFYRVSMVYVIRNIRPTSAGK